MIVLSLLIMYVLIVVCVCVEIFVLDALRDASIKQTAQKEVMRGARAFLTIPAGRFGGLRHKRKNNSITLGRYILISHIPHVCSGPLSPFHNGLATAGLSGSTGSQNNGCTMLPDATAPLFLNTQYWVLFVFLHTQ